MRTKLVVANWKMNMTQPEAAVAAEAMGRMFDDRKDVDVVVCPPYLSIYRVRDILRNSAVKIGAQDVFWVDKGAFTGQVSAPMLVDAGVTFCIVGHSETRGRFGKLEVPESTLSHFGETDETVNLKIKALLFQSVSPILCVGETDAERQAGQTDAVIRRQIEAAFEGIESAELFFTSIAYEPVWAIGTGNTCDAAEAERVCAMIRGVVEGLYGADLAGEILILYGGSVKSSNARELFSQPNIDGGLVGGASLDYNEFAKIVQCA